MKINPRVLVVREAISKMVEMLSTKKIRVTQQGAQAFVEHDPKTGKPVRVNIPYLPDDASDELITATQGFLDHEVGHLLYSDFDVLSRIALGKGASSQRKFLANIIEDTFIEREMAARFQGSGSNLAAVGQFVLDKVIAPRVNEGKATPADLMVPLLRAMAGQAVFRDYMPKIAKQMEPIIKGLGPDFAQMLKDIKSTTDTERVTDELIKRLGKVPEDEKPEPSKEPKEPGKGAPEKDGKGEASEPDKTNPDDAGEPGTPDEEEGEGDAAPEKDDDAEKGDKGKKAPKEPKEPKEKKEKEPKAKKEKAEKPADEPPKSDDKGEGEDEGDEGDEGEPGGEDAGESGEGEGEGDEEADAGEDDKDGTGSKAGKSDGKRKDTQELDKDAGDGSLEEGANAHESAFEGAIGDQNSNIAVDDGIERTPPLEMLTGMDADFDDMAAKAIAEAAVVNAEGAEYLIWTTDYDKMDPLPIPADLFTNPSGMAALHAMIEATEHMVAPMQKDLERAVAARSAAVWTAGHRSGRLHGASLARLATNRDDVFRRKQNNTTKDVAVELVVDGSGSMQDKIETASRAAYALSSTLDRLQISNEVVAFTTAPFPREAAERLQKDLDKLTGRPYYSRQEAINMPIIKQFHERMNATVRERFCVLGNFFHGGLRSNVDGESVQTAYKRLMQRRETRKVMIVLSDGQPAAHGDARELQKHLKQVVLGIEARGVDVIGIGIRSDAVSKYYRKHVVLGNVSDLPNEVMKRLKDMLIVV